MVLTFNNYKQGNATIGDVINVWDSGQLPKRVFNYFEDNITDVTIRSLHQSNFEIFKDSLVVDTIIEIDSYMAIVTKNKNDWQIILYRYEKNKSHKTVLKYQEASFVRKNNDLLPTLRKLLVEYTMR